MGLQHAPCLRGFRAYVAVVPVLGRCQRQRQRQRCLWIACRGCAEPARMLFVCQMSLYSSVIWQCWPDDTRDDIGPRRVHLGLMLTSFARMLNLSIFRLTLSLSQRVHKLNNCSPNSLDVLRAIFFSLQLSVTWQHGLDSAVCVYGVYVCCALHGGNNVRQSPGESVVTVYCSPQPRTEQHLAEAERAYRAFL
jgi:hypothetical protein